MMKVIFRGWSGSERHILQGSSALKSDREYSVLEVFSQADGANKFRIEHSPHEIAALFDSRLFEISSAEIPRGWHIKISPNGALTFGPVDWATPGFWEALMEHEDWAESAYRSGRAKSLDENS